MPNACYTAHVTLLRDGLPRRLSLQAASLAHARLVARVQARALFRGLPFSFSVSPA